VWDDFLVEYICTLFSDQLSIQNFMIEVYVVVRFLVFLLNV